MRFATGVVVLFLFGGFSSMTWAQTAASEGSKATGSQKKKTSINFEDQLVTGELRKPELFYLLQKKQFNFGRLIKLRENFVPELRRTSEEIQRGSE